MEYVLSHIDYPQQRPIQTLNLPLPRYALTRSEIWIDCLCGLVMLFTQSLSITQVQLDSWNTQGMARSCHLSDSGFHHPSQLLGPQPKRDNALLRVVHDIPPLRRFVHCGQNWCWCVYFLVQSDSMSEMENSRTSLLSSPPLPSPSLPSPPPSSHSLSSLPLALSPSLHLSQLV